MLYNVKKKTSSDEDWFSPNVEFKGVLLKYKKIIHQMRLIMIINPEMNFNRVYTVSIRARRIRGEANSPGFYKFCVRQFM